MLLISIIVTLINIFFYITFSVIVSFWIYRFWYATFKKIYWKRQGIDIDFWYCMVEKRIREKR